MKTQAEIETRLRLLRQKQSSLERPRPVCRDHAALARTVTRIIELREAMKALKARKLVLARRQRRWNEAIRLAREIEQMEI
jgi:tRNA A37 N6-isopentenylltransferase MiaA